MLKAPETTAALIARTFSDRATRQEVNLQEVQKGLDQLAKRAVIDSFDASEQAISIEPDGTFKGEGVVYVSLEYPDDVKIGEELPVTFHGRMDADSGEIEFEHIDVDLSPFYGEEVEF